MKEIIVASALVILLAAIANPFHWWMPTMLQMLILICIFAAFSIFAVFVLCERARDEREGLHRMQSGRAAFLSGSAVLTVAIIVQELRGTLDLWLVVALVVMVLAKIGTNIYSEKHN